MDAEQYRRMADLQDHHWWFEAKRTIVGEALSRVAPAGTGGSRVLEVGCGTGSMLPLLGRFGRPVGVDAYVPALRYIPRASVVGGNALALPFADAVFDLVGCFDVLYHRRVTDVADALGELRRVCRPGGLVIITDSAGPGLMSAHDVAMHGARRFRLGDFETRVREAGFEVIHGSYYHTILFPVAATLRMLSRVTRGVPEPEAGGDARVEGHSDLTPAPAWVNAMLRPLYRIEARLVSRHRLPFGLSLLVAARRRVG